ncbi:MAG: hypothetical protein AAFW60_08660 [Pseudomonadota bacterium]
MKKTVSLGIALAMFGAATASANEYESRLSALAQAEIAAIASSPQVIEAIRAQNAETASFGQPKIDELDQTWRAEVGSSGQTMISEVLGRSASQYLSDQREASAGLFTEIFVMDGKGLNVAQSDVTSDYWQGDEAKWQDTFGQGPGAIHISEIEEDESTQTFQSQVSMTIVDPDNGAAIGAITVGVNIEMIE